MRERNLAGHVEFRGFSDSTTIGQRMASAIQRLPITIRGRQCHTCYPRDPKHPTWFYVLSTYLKSPCPTNPPYYLPQTLHPLDKAGRRHPTRLNHLAIFAAPDTIFVTNAPMHKRILIRVDAA